MKERKQNAALAEIRLTSSEAPKLNNVIFLAEIVGLAAYAEHTIEMVPPSIIAKDNSED